jgi:hypothetical protein
MSLHFRHYEDRNMAGKGDFRLGWMVYDRRQPTLDILIGKHVFVMFWMRKNR